MAIYLDDEDCTHFLKRLDEVAASHELDCHAYCLMRNHYHLVATTNRANLSHAIQQLNSPHAQWWNRRHSRPGHVFQGRFGAQVIQDETYLLTACRYVVLNPVRAGLVTSPDQWPWSSYRATAGLDAIPPFLRPELLWHRLGTGEPGMAARRYRDFIGSNGSETSVLPRDLVVGDEQFVNQFEAWRAAAGPEVPLRERRARRPLEEYFSDVSTAADRANAASEAYRAGYSQTQIASHLRLHYTTVSKMISRLPGAGRRTTRK